MNKKLIANRVALLQDIGMLLFLIALFIGTLITAVSPEELVLQNLLMLVALFLVVVLVMFRAQYAAVVVTAFAILAFAAYKLYSYFSAHTAIESTAYVWGFLLIAMLGGLSLFIREFSATELANSVLHTQIEELTVIDPLTGLDNLRSMYSDLARTMALCRRNGTDMGLMLVKLRYANELRGILSRKGYELLRGRVASIAQDTVRLEDRVYSIDKDGSLGIIYFCDSSGAAVVKRRLLEAYSQKESFSDITDKPIRVEMRIAYLEYENEMETNAIHFRTKVESELQYDV